MKKNTQILVFATLLLIAVGCKNNTCYNQLEQVDTLTENNFIDSASHLIYTIEQTYKINEGKEKAYYNLLK